MVKEYFVNFVFVQARQMDLEKLFKNVVHIILWITFLNLKHIFSALNEWTIEFGIGFFCDKADTNIFKYASYRSYTYINIFGPRLIEILFQGKKYRI
jgi:hypothetical protein